MTKKVGLFLVGVLLLLAACDKKPPAEENLPARFVDGEHFFPLPSSALNVDDLNLLLQPRAESGQVEVFWFFWYGCPACRKALPMLDQLASRLEPLIRLYTVPLALGSWIPEAEYYYLLRQLGLADRARNDFYAAVQEGELGRGAAPEAVAQWLENRFEVAKKESLSLLEGKKTQEYIRQSSRMAQAFDIRRVPVVVVARRYLVTLGSSQGQLVEVVEELVKKELSR